MYSRGFFFHAQARQVFRITMISPSAEAISLLRRMHASANRIGVEALAALFDFAPTLAGRSDHEQNDFGQLFEELKKLVAMEESVR